MPGQVRVLYNLALAFQKMGQNDEAEKTLLEAIRREPSTPEFHYALAVHYVRMRKKEKALKSIRNLMFLAPQDPGLNALLQAVEKTQPH